MEMAGIAVLDDLPVELILASFRYLDLEDCITVSHVCSRWRRVALSDPLLWSSVTTYGWPMSAFKEILSRTQGAPVCLDPLDIAPHTMPQCIRLLAQHLHHIRVLVLNVWRSEFTAEVSAALCAAAPLLESFVIQAHESDAVVLPTNIFCGFAPRLRHAKLDVVWLPPRCPGLASVSVLEVRLAMLPPAEPCRLSEIFPILKSLVLWRMHHGVHFSLEDDHTLQRLEIHEVDMPSWVNTAERDARAQLLALHHPRIGVISLATESSESKNTRGLMLDGLGGSLETVSLRKSDEPCDGWANAVNVDLVFSPSAEDRAASRTRRLRVFTMRHWLPVGGSSRPLFSGPLTAHLHGVTSFYVERRLLSVKPPCMPNVRLLCVEYSSDYETFEADHNGGGLALWISPDCVPCLETLTLRGGSVQLNGCRTLAMALSAQHLAITILLRGSRIPNLVVDRLSLMEPREVANSLLLSTVDSFTWLTELGEAT